MAKISIDQDLAMLIKEQLTAGLKEKGFKIVSYEPNAERTLSVELRSLEYNTSMGFWTGGVEVSGALKVDAEVTQRQYS
jgi:hypothetical protein